MGVLGSALGFVAGFGMAQLLRGLLTGVGIKLPAGGLVLLPRTVIASFVVGIVITLVSAVLPCASRCAGFHRSPHLRDVAVEQPSFSTRRLLSGVGLFVTVGRSRRHRPRRADRGSRPRRCPGVRRPSSSSDHCSPDRFHECSAHQSPVARHRRRTRPRERHAQSEANRSHRRIADGRSRPRGGDRRVRRIGEGVDPFVFAKQFTGDFVVSTQTFGFGGLPVTLAPEISQLPGVRAATGVQLGLAKVNGDNRTFAVVDPATVWNDVRSRRCCPARSNRWTTRAC